MGTVGHPAGAGAGFSQANPACALRPRWVWPPLPHPAAAAETTAMATAASLEVPVPIAGSAVVVGISVTSVGPLWDPVRALRRRRTRALRRRGRLRRRGCAGYDGRRALRRGGRGTAGTAAACGDDAREHQTHHRQPASPLESPQHGEPRLYRESGWQEALLNERDAARRPTFLAGVRRKFASCSDASVRDHRYRGHGRRAARPGAGGGVTALLPKGRGGFCV